MAPGQSLDLAAQELARLAQELPSKRLLHVNSASLGGGVAELLQSQVALEQGLGLDARWVVIEPSHSKFFTVTKKIHNLLQGAEGELTNEDKELYQRVSEELHQDLEQYLEAAPADWLVIHDPQPALAASGLAGGPRIWRLHIDLCQPNPTIIDWLCEMSKHFAYGIVSRADCYPLCLPPSRTAVIPPAIDPDTEKNNPLPRSQAQAILRRHGLDTGRPIIAQVSRFDYWKDPLGVLAAFRLAQKIFPQAQLLLVGFIQAADDPQAADYLKEVKKQAEGDPNIHLLADLSQLKGASNNQFINAVQVASDVIVQKSVREGFGLTVTEAMWKGKAVVGGDAGGIRLQITDGENGLLVHTVDEAAAAIIRLLADPGLRQRLGQAAKTSVARRYLMPRYLRDHLIAYRQVL